MLRFFLLFTVVAAYPSDYWKINLLQSTGSQGSAIDISSAYGRELLLKFFKSSLGRQYSFKVAVATWLRHDGARQWNTRLPLFYEHPSGKAYSEFFVLDGNFTAEEAFEACHKLDGAILGSLNSEARWEAVNKHLVAGNYWFGLSRWARCSQFICTYGNLMGQTLSGSWEPNEPQPRATDFDCARTVSPPSLTCDLWGCSADEFTSLRSEKCSTKGFAALCEKIHPSPLYGLIRGYYDWTSAVATCKHIYGETASLAMPRRKAEFDRLFASVSAVNKNWNCWVGQKRFQEDITGKGLWLNAWIDGSPVIIFDHLPYVKRDFDDAETCASLQDGTFAEWKGCKGSKGFYDFNECDAKLHCAVCQWNSPL